METTIDARIESLLMKRAGHVIDRDDETKGSRCWNQSQGYIEKVDQQLWALRGKMSPKAARLTYCFLVKDASPSKFCSETALPDVAETLLALERQAGCQREIAKIKKSAELERREKFAVAITAAKCKR